jgi:cobalt-zinc-cadmium efflux system outer membrane protein
MRSMMKRTLLSAALLTTLTFPGCTSTDPSNKFADVQRDVEQRTNGQKIRWNRGTAADAAVAEEVRGLLATPLMPEAAVQIALLNNRSLQALYEDLSIGQADLVEAGLLRNPVFDADIHFPVSGGGFGLEMALVQDFISLLYIPLRTQLAAATLERAKLRVAGGVIDVAGQVRVAYVELQASMQTKELREQIVAATGASYDLAQRLRAAGNNRALDLHNEQALFEQAKIDLRAAELQVLRGRERLNTLMGVWGEQTQWTLPMRLPELPAEDLAADDLEQKAIDRSLDLGIIRQETVEAGRMLGIARPLALLGDLELGAAAEREPEGHWSVGPAFSFPIPLFNQGQGQVARVQAMMRRSQQAYHATTVRLRAQVRTAQAAVLAAREQAVQYHKVLLPLRQKILDETLLQYNAMQIGAFQLLVAKQQQIETANAYIRNLRDYWLARAELDQILSGRMSNFETPAMEMATPSAPAASGGH